VNGLNTSKPNPKQMWRIDATGGSVMATIKLSVWILGVSLFCAFAKTSPTVLKVKIEGTELDRKMLLSKLNENGKDRVQVRHGMKFELVDADYDYRIVFATGQGTTQATTWGSGGSMNSSSASADVFDGKGTELFKFERNQRWTDEGASNAVAEEIIKRILKLNKLNSRHD
jgi:hypothetical protein